MHFALNDLVVSVADDIGVDTTTRKTTGRYTKSPNIAGERHVKGAKPLDTWVMVLKGFHEKGMSLGDRLRAMIDEPVMVTDYNGNDRGEWVVKSVDDKGSELDNVGISGQSDVTLTLEEVKQDETQSIVW